VVLAVALVVALAVVSFQSNCEDLLLRYLFLILGLASYGGGLPFGGGLGAGGGLPFGGGLGVGGGLPVGGFSGGNFFLTSKQKYIFIIAFRLRRCFTIGVSFIFFIDVSLK
jgi:hypothetical protein